MTTSHPPTTLPAICPAWCTSKEECDWETWTATGQPVRTHDGPTFGEVYTFADEKATCAHCPSEPLTIRFGISDDIDRDRFDVKQAQTLAADLACAIKWAEEQA